MKLKEKIKNYKAIIGIIGLGYVGLPLSIAFLEKGFKVIGFDIDDSKLSTLKQGQSYLDHINYDFMPAIKKNLFKATRSFKQISNVDVVIICVPTPLDKYRNPDLSSITKTAESIKNYIKKDQLIVLESTTYPGTTTEILSPILEDSGLKANKDFFLAYSPEREDPGNKNFETTTIPKLVGADTKKSRDLAVQFYKSVIDDVFECSGTKIAEAAKLTENIFRSVNIALVNELKIVFDAMGIDVWEVIRAASSKPFGYMPFFPGPGLGGHCIPVDPFYLTYKSKEFNLQTKFIELAAEINTFMPEFVLKKTSNALNVYKKKSINGSNILIIGLAYKKDIGDMRESPTLPIMRSLIDQGAKVKYHDKFIPQIPDSRQYGFLTGLKSVPINKQNLSKADVVIIITDHSYINYDLVSKYASLIVDTRNIMSGRKLSNVIKA